MFAEDALIPLSALQHFVVCPRQCALIHLERTWSENARTAEGRAAHERVDQGGDERRGGVRRAFGVPLRSSSLGLIGRADVVEFHAGPGGIGEVPFPVEHKRGKPKRGDEDRVQLCAQAMCLEEMLNVPIADGALFYGQRRRRTVVSLDGALRRKTVQVAAAVHDLFAAGVTPPPPDTAPCGGCSLIAACRPETFRVRRRGGVSSWIARRLRAAEQEDPS